MVRDFVPIFAKDRLSIKPFAGATQGEKSGWAVII
jgi:hypothetical protein